MIQLAGQGSSAFTHPDRRFKDMIPLDIEGKPCNTGSLSDKTVSEVKSFFESLKADPSSNEKAISGSSSQPSTSDKGTGVTRS